MQITIIFKEFDTEPPYDKVVVSECSSQSCESIKVLATLSGIAPGHNVTSDTGYMLVMFTSDDSANKQGFTASWQVRFFFLKWVSVFKR